ncbi:hypothetical protein [Paractinoplanes rishiriensis]|uniref:Uncharacterized protein n=1 Tax=Paractinoplanes rishiriensis TaxID=1050105 RepID=A0A919K565_9ACTN|nr:hypothetical protein [Actinoplanes rishiriensis]GIE98778.1 hypothetical protein Ari01nite_62430 [Actinoplanes rishiriensis]
MVARGLSTDELAAIRDGLAAGRKPRVQFTEAAGQISGQIGQVVSLDDPAVSDEWVVVRFGRDELPFSPTDLRVAPRGVAARKAVPAAEPKPEPPAPPMPEFVIDKPVPVKKASVAPPPAPAAGREAAGREDGVVSAPAPRKGGDDVTASAPRKAASRSAKSKPAPSLTVTLAYGEGEWTIAANQGAKVLAKPYVIRPAEALRMVSLVDMPGVQEAVEHILAAERAEAEQQAQRLRAELAEVEARLAELGDAH